MTAEDAEHDEVLAGNVDRLIGRGEPPVRMPDDVRARIQSRLARETSPRLPWLTAGRRLSPARFAFTTVAPVAVVLLVVALVVFWPRQRVSAVSWPAVVSHVGSARTVVVYGYSATTDSNGHVGCGGGKVYVRDDGGLRVEAYSRNGGMALTGPCTMTLDDFSAANLSGVMVTSASPGTKRQTLDLFVRNHSAHLRDGGPSTNDGHVPTVDWWWQELGAVTENATHRLDDQVFGGRLLAGFETSIETFDANARDGFVRVWVDPVTTLPMRVELQWERRVQRSAPDVLGRHRETHFHIDWNPDIPDELLELRVPEGWVLTRQP